MNIREPKGPFLKPVIRAAACMALFSIAIFLQPRAAWAQGGLGGQSGPRPPIPSPVRPSTPPAQPQSTPRPASLLKQQTGGAPQASKTDHVVLNFQDADLLDVIHTIFGDILKVNYTVDPSVKGRVTIRIVSPISEESVLPTMKMLLKQNGAGFTVENGIYKIMPLNAIPETSRQVYVYPLQNSKADHVAQILQSIFTGAAMPSGRAAPGGAPGAVVTQPMAQAGGTRALVSPSTRVIADKITNSLVILATPEDYKFIKKTITQLDTIPRQVMIDVLVAEVSLTDDLQFGLEWVLSHALHIAAGSLTGIAGQGLISITNGTSISAPAIVQPPQGTPSGEFTYTAVDSAGNVKALLQMLASKGKVNVLASPHIIAADNREASIQIGQEIPIATSQATQVGAGAGVGTSILSTIQYKDTGVILKVTPQINESGLVALKVTAEDSEAVQTAILGTEQFVIDKKQVTTDLVAQDGQTIVLGGLISQQTQKTKSGIPLLSDIPVLGYLFGTTDHSTSKDEIIVLLTPHVIRNQEEAGAVTDQYLNRLKGMDNSFKAALPGISGDTKPDSSKNKN